MAKYEKISFQYVIDEDRSGDISKKEMSKFMKLLEYDRIVSDVFVKELDEILACIEIEIDTEDEFYIYVDL